MINWVHHGQASTGQYVTSAEFVDGKAYIYHDFPNDQDPHLVIDSDHRWQAGQRHGDGF